MDARMSEKFPPRHAINVVFRFILIWRDGDPVYRVLPVRPLKHTTRWSSASKLVAVK